MTARKFLSLLLILIPSTLLFFGSSVQAPVYSHRTFIDLLASIQHFPYNSLVLDYILKTPNCVLSACSFTATASPKPSTCLVSRGLITPSSHKRAEE